MHWSYIFLALSHQYRELYCESFRENHPCYDDTALFYGKKCLVYLVPCFCLYTHSAMYINLDSQEALHEYKMKPPLILPIAWSSEAIMASLHGSRLNSLPPYKTCVFRIQHPHPSGSVSPKSKVTLSNNITNWDSLLFTKKMFFKFNNYLTMRDARYFLCIMDT